jgi:hypothetical protein
MPALCDVNVLLAFCYDRHAHHAAALAWLDVQPSRSAALVRVTQLGLLRLLCHATVMGADVCTLAGAWSIYDALQADERFRFVSEPEAVEAILRRLTRASSPRPQLWTDAYLAAFALSAGLHLVTFDRGFRQFTGLDVILLP